MPVIKNDSKDKSDDMSGEDMDETTALIPKSILAGKDVDVGDTVMLDVVHIYDDEVEVKYSNRKNDKDKKDKDKKESNDNDDTSDAMRSAEDDLDELAGAVY